MTRGNWTDNECYYVSIIDGDKKALVAGPFRRHEEALEMVERARKAGNKLDLRSHFFFWGTAKAATGHHEGCLNKVLGI